MCISGSKINPIVQILRSMVICIYTLCQFLPQCYKHTSPVLVFSNLQPNKEEDGENYRLKFLPQVAQEIIDEFALRYAVEPIFRMMVYG